MLLYVYSVRNIRESRGKVILFRIRQGNGICIVPGVNGVTFANFKSTACLRISFFGRDKRIIKVVKTRAHLFQALNMK